MSSNSVGSSSHLAAGSSFGLRSQLGLIGGSQLAVKQKKIRRDLSRRIFSTAGALSDVNLSRRVERSGNAGARVDAPFIIGRRRCCSSSGSTTSRGPDHRSLRALAKYL